MRLGSASPTAGDPLLLQIIGAVVLGGTVLTGGEGGILRSVTGALLIAMIVKSLGNSRRPVLGSDDRDRGADRPGSAFGVMVSRRRTSGSARRTSAPLNLGDQTLQRPPNPETEAPARRRHSALPDERMTQRCVGAGPASGRRLVSGRCRFTGVKAPAQVARDRSQEGEVAASVLGPNFREQADRAYGDSGRTGASPFLFVEPDTAATARNKSRPRSLITPPEWPLRSEHQAPVGPRNPAHGFRSRPPLSFGTADPHELARFEQPSSMARRARTSARPS